MNSFYERHKDGICWRYRCFDRILLNGLIQPFQQPERVVGFFNTYRRLYPVTRYTLRGRTVMRSFQRVAASIAFSALMAASATCARAEDAPLGVRLVDQMNALYGAHPGVRASHAKGAVFEGMSTPAQGADALSSAVFLKGAPTPPIIRFSNARHPPFDRPCARHGDQVPSIGWE
jgi:hypothetical protein